MNPVTRKAIEAGIKANVWLYRRTDGRVGGRGMGRLPLLLLTVPGRRSGTRHTVPIAYLDHNKQRRKPIIEPSVLRGQGMQSRT